MYFVNTMESSMMVSVTYVQNKYYGFSSRYVISIFLDGGDTRYNLEPIWPGCNLSIGKAKW